MNTSRKTAQRRDLTKEKIIEATLKVLKNPDPAALTMRRVADECGVSAMAIYHHVNDKDKLATLAVDSIFLRAAKAPRRGTTWREQVINLWLGIRQDLLDTPGAGMIFVRQAILGPGTATATERMFECFHESNLSGDAIAEAMDAMTMLSIGSLANELTRPPKVREKLGEQVPDEQTPLLRKNMDTYATRDGTERYKMAMEWLLDGVVHQAAK